jgi:hypothetical protein
MSCIFVVNEVVKVIKRFILKKKVRTYMFFINKLVKSVNDTTQF